MYFYNEEAMEYGFGDSDLKEEYEHPTKLELDIPEYDYYYLSDDGTVEQLPNYYAEQNLVVVIDNYEGDTVRLTIPEGVRNLYVTAGSNKHYNIELDCVDHEGLERIVFGEIDITKDIPFGEGNFILENLDGLEGCSNLKEIYIDFADASDISGIADCDKLEVIHLNGNRITDISDLADKEYLTEVELSGNNTKNLEILENCIRLNR